MDWYRHSGKRARQASAKNSSSMTWRRRAKTGKAGSTCAKSGWGLKRHKLDKDQATLCIMVNFPSGRHRAISGWSAPAWRTKSRLEAESLVMLADGENRSDNEKKE